MAGGENNNHASVEDVSEQEPREPLLKKQILEPKLAGLAAGVDGLGEVAAAAFLSGNSDGEHLQALRVKKLAPEAILPSRGSAYAAGYDLSSAYEAIVPGRGKALVKTELSIAIPEGTYARIASRSGLAWKHSIDVGAGVIDFDYRGPVGVILFNHSDADFSIKAGDRIAQLILERITTPKVVEVDDLDATARGVGGFGSTGVALVALDVTDSINQ